MTPILLLAVGLGCTQPLHLQYDYGRAFTESMAIQADLTRESVAESGYALSGDEGLELRQRVFEKSTDEESGETETTSSISVE